VAGEERQIKRARLIGPKDYRTIWQKMHYERAQEMQKAREEAEPKAVITPKTVPGAPRPEFGPPAVVLDGDFIDRRHLLPPARPLAPHTASGAPQSNWDRLAMEQEERRHCFGPPDGPPGVLASEMAAQVKQNGDLAAQHDPTDLAWFKSQVENHQPWDYKRYDPEFEDFGNYNYGYAGTRQGISAAILRAAAGYAQIRGGTSEWRFIDSAFDDPKDQEQINRGISDAVNKCY
jgi:hypothetical protein